jgi:hypothetical protein
MAETQKNQMMTGIMVVAVIGLLTLGVVLYTGEGKVQNTNQTQNRTQNQEQAREDAEGFAQAFRDGQYTATGVYTSPGGAESIDVVITLEDNLVVDATVTPNASLPISINYQTMFVDNYQELVLGKNISEIQLDVVSGSSLTPKGFNNALEQIKVQAAVDA